jgi:hypothetical protein
MEKVHYNLQPLTQSWLSNVPTYCFSYICEMLEKDHEKFQVPHVVNPYMDDDSFYARPNPSTLEEMPMTRQGIQVGGIANILSTL